MKRRNILVGAGTLLVSGCTGGGASNSTETVPTTSETDVQNEVTGEPTRTNDQGDDSPTTNPHETTAITHTFIEIWNRTSEKQSIRITITDTNAQTVVFDEVRQVDHGARGDVSDYNVDFPGDFRIRCELDSGEHGSISVDIEHENWAANNTVFGEVSPEGHLSLRIDEDESEAPN